jgi:hypothetical protein
MFALRVARASASALPAFPWRVSARISRPHSLNAPSEAFRSVLPPQVKGRAAPSSTCRVE